MTRPTVTPGVVARWTTRARPAHNAICDECLAVLDEDRCANCGQLAGRLVGMIATLVDTPACSRIVVAQRSAGGWVPVKAIPATADNLRALSRSGATGPALTTVGGLW
jgi:hypothetical protein